MDLVVVLVVVALVVAALATYIVLSARGPRETARPMPPPRIVGFRPLSDVTIAATPSLPEPAISASGAPPLFDLDLEPAIAPSAPVEIRWSGQFDPRSGTLDHVARLRLIGDLGVVGKEWCVPLLCQAYEEERRPGHRQAALIALAACRSRTAAATFRLALTASDPAERAIAADALADLEPPPQAKSRRTVERR
jgi:hypothetical protein